jgi:segregation and condensation protein B
MIKLEHTLEAFLFVTGETYTVNELAKIFSKDRDEVEEALLDLELSLKTRGVQLVRVGDEIALVAAKEISPILTALRQKELSSPLSQAALDTLSIVLYASPIEKKQIDYIRGVDSRAILRTLKVRGLVREDTVEEGRGRVVYNPTVELMRSMGLQRTEDLPEYAIERAEILRVVNNEEQATNTTHA